MATVTPQEVPADGIALTMFAAAVAGDAVFNNSGSAVLLVTNGGGSSINVTINAPAGVKFPTGGGYPPQSVANQVVAVAAGVTKHVRLFPKQNDSSTLVQITYSSVTSVTIGALAL
jgi:hypothetical protein